MIRSSISGGLSDALTYFPPGPLSLCLFGDKFFFGDFWSSIGVDNSFRCKIYFICSRDSMLDTVDGSSWLFFIFPFQWFLLVPFLQKCFWILEIPTNWPYRLSLWWFVWRAAWKLSLLGHNYMVHGPSLLLFRFEPHISVSVSVVLKFSTLSSRISNCFCLWLCLVFRFSVFYRDVVRMGSPSVWCVLRNALLSRFSLYFRFNRSCLLDWR